jgi:molecular chaperone DnaK
VDVTPHSLGIAVAETRGGRLVSDRYKPLIRRNTTIPVTAEEIFYTIYPWQDSVEVEVYQGEKPIASQNTLLGKFLISDLEAEAEGELAKITVQFDLNLDGMLMVTARDRQSGRQENISVAASKARLSEDEILAARRRLSEIELIDEAPELPAETEALLVKADQMLAAGTLASDTAEELADLAAALREATDEAAQTELADGLLDLLYELEG